jgi:hypothetical protein
MSTEIEIIVDDGGIALIGDEKHLDRLLATSQLTSMPIDLSRLTPIVGQLGVAAQGGAEIAANAGRWLKLTKESAKALKLGNAMKGSTVDVARAVMTENGKVSKILEFVKPGQLLSNPAVLTGVGGMMAQFAMQQAMKEITDYLKRIEEKLGDVVQSLKHAQIAPMLAAADIIDDVMAVRDSVGRVSGISWSKVQSCATALATAQNYALLQLDTLIKKMSGESNAANAAVIAKEVEVEVTDWLVVIANSLRLQDAAGVIELERVFDSEPEELEQHRVGLRSARARRLAKVESAIGDFCRLLEQSADYANKDVFWHPYKTPQLIKSATSITETIAEFQRLIGVELQAQTFEAKPWKEGVFKVKDEVVENAQGLARRVKNLSVDVAHKIVAKSEEIKTKIAEGNKPKD